MLKNEYGAVQQHLEPNHIADLLIPIPEDWNQVSDIIQETRKLITEKERMELRFGKIIGDINSLTQSLINKSKKSN